MEKIPPSLVDVITASENDLYVSVVSAWEIQIKKQMGKLSLAIPFDEM